MTRSGSILYREAKSKDGKLICVNVWNIRGRGVIMSIREGWWVKFA